ncbi:MAG: ShlB/FhaC/HecB family hemolysin secretion/activation protein [Steroidobacteraceae bacterium]
MQSPSKLFSWLATLFVVACIGNAHSQEAPPAEPKPLFSIDEYRVLGNSVLPATAVEELLMPRLGAGKSIDDVEQARLALENHYHELGYGTVFVDIPEQDVEEGIVRLRVTEGVLSRTRVVGARYFSGRKILAALPAAAPNTVPHVPTLQAQLAELNTRTADRSVVPVLKAGRNPGTVDLALNVQDEVPVHATLELNNDYTTDTSELRGIASVSYDNLFDRLDSISLQYQFSPQDSSEVSVWAGSYTARLTDAGLRWSFFYVNSDSNVATAGDGGSGVDVLGKGQIYGTRLIAPLVATAEASHTLVAGIEYKDFTESVFSKDLVLTPITYVNLSVGESSAWRGDTRTWSFGATANFGSRGVVNDTEEFRIKRYRGAANYFLLRADGSFATQLPAGLTLRWRANTQYAVDSIISNEQFSIAGSDGVRGYLEAESLGDVGARSSLELGSPRLVLLQERLAGDAFVFYDYGRMSRNNPLHDGDPDSPTYGALLEPNNVTLRSAGVGLNFAAFHTMTGSLTWAYPLADTPDASGTRTGDSRIHFNVRAAW